MSNLNTSLSTLSRRRLDQLRAALGRPHVVTIGGAVLFALAVGLIIAYAAITPLSDTVTLSTGQVAPRDVRAPRSISYESAVLTKLARDTAAANVRPIFDPPDPQVLRTQVQQARRLLNQIETVRQGSQTPTQKAGELAVLPNLTVAPDDFSSIIGFTEDEWKQLDAEVLSVLERVMRTEIRESEIDIVGANVPNLVSVQLDDRRADLVTSIVRGLIRPNAYYNDERTRLAREAASNTVPVETRSFVQGQIVVRGGSVVTDADIEALAQLGLIDPSDRRLRLLGGGLITLLIVLILLWNYVRRFDPNMLQDWRRLAALGVIFALFLGGARAFGFRLDSDLPMMLYPAAAFALIAPSLTSTRGTIFMTAALGSLIALMTSFTDPTNAVRTLLFVSLGGMAGALILRQAERINTYFVAGAAVAVVNAGAAVAFVLIQETPSVIDVGTNSATAALGGLLNGALSAGVAVVGLYLISSVLNLPTSIKLLELSAPSQPLLQRLLREAPGTYQHSLMVANLAELAAEQIEADAPLVRVGALYHDIGKLSNPNYFVENQAEGLNPHDILGDPKRSAQIIIGHVTEGQKLARRYSLPRVMTDFILQHHGTTPVLYFYNKALEERVGNESQLDKSAFTYPGPRPQTREAGLLMLADTSESVVRAKRPRTKGEIATIINEIFEGRMADGQLDDTGLTVNDLRITREVFVSTLQGVFHPRIEYPKRSTQELTTVD